MKGLARGAKAMRPGRGHARRRSLSLGLCASRHRQGNAGATVNHSPHGKQHPTPRRRVLKQACRIAPGDLETTIRCRDTGPFAQQMVVATFLIAFARPCLLRHPQPRRNDALRLPIDFAMHTVSQSFISDRRNERNSKRAREGRDPAIHHASPCEGGIQEVMFILTLIWLDAATNSGLHAQVGSAGARLSSIAGRLGVAGSAWGDRHYIFGGNGRRGSCGREELPDARQRGLAAG